MIDHICINVSDFEGARAFYTAVLAPLGYRLLHSFGDDALGFGAERATFWVVRRDPVSGGAHVAVQVSDRATVDAFHAAALAAGGTDHGAPGLRPQYHEHYYGAFVLDADGHNIEAVCHQPS